MHNPYKLLFFLDRIQKLGQKTLDVFQEAKVKSLRKEKKPFEVTIAVLQIANLFSFYIAFVDGTIVTCDVRLRHNASDLHISSSAAHDVNFAWLACFLQGVAFCVTSRVFKEHM
ncbi:hypothetical protein TNCV_3094561 [Trichonephila clavipes]|nr:hypothetical protein TNCV_3094561 [Trichonephila clavipes]